MNSYAQRTERYRTQTNANDLPILHRQSGASDFLNASDRCRTILPIFYTNIEGEAINRLYRAVDEGAQGLVMNPAGFNHAGYALRDCVRALPFPYVEVHMTNIEKREIHSVLTSVAVGAVFGFGVHSYVLGLDAMLGLLRK